MTSAVSPAEPQFLYLTTRGRKTGLPREIEIWFVTHGRFYVLAERGRRAQWVKNVLAHPHVRVRVGGREFAATARVLEEDDDAQVWSDVRRLSEQKYGWGGGLPVELDPGASSARLAVTPSL